jgi:pilus assembly protein CpaE
MITKLFTKTKEEDLSGETRSLSAPAHTTSIDLPEDLISEQKAPAPIVAVLGAKGGVGASTLCANLAAALANVGAATTIIDANFQQPDIAHLCGQDPPHSLTELMARSSIVDSQLFEACAIEIPQTNITVLSPPLNGEAIAKSNLSDLTRCIRHVRSYSQYWIIDVPRHLDKHLVTLTDICDKIVLVFEATVAGVAASQRWLGVFRELGYDPDRIMCVLNRSGSKYSGVEQQLASCFAEHTVYRIPNASTLMWECETRGRLAVLANPGHAYSRAILKLAKHVYASTSGR